MYRHLAERGKIPRPKFPQNVETSLGTSIDHEIIPQVDERKHFVVDHAACQQQNSTSVELTNVCGIRIPAIFGIFAAFQYDRHFASSPVFWITAGMLVGMLSHRGGKFE